MFVDDDLQVVCRDEDCRLDYLHQAHLFSASAEEIRTKQDRNPVSYRWADPEGLAGCLRRIFETHWPLSFGEIASFIWNDYGSVTERTIHRRLARMSSDGEILELSLEGLRYIAYIRKDSRYLGDEDNLRDHLLGKHSRIRRKEI